MPWNRLDPPHRVIYTGVVALLLTTAGCATPVGSDVDDPQRVASQVETRYDSLDAYQTTVVRTIATGERTETTRATITVETGSRMRVDYHTGPRAGTTAVTDEPANASLFLTDDRDESKPRHSSYGALAAQIVRTNNVTYRGQTRLGDHPAAILSVTPTANTSADRAGPEITERLVWIDTERRVPLRIRTVWEENGREVTETIQFTDISLAANASRSGGVAA